MINDPILHELAERRGTVYGLRHVPATNSYRGIIDGVCVEVVVANQCLNSLLFSPNASLISPIANRFAGFQHTASGGVALGSLRGILKSKKDDLGSCMLELTIPQLCALGPEKFDQVLAQVAKDFADLGADPSKLECGFCRAPAPTVLVVQAEHYQTICEKCFEGIQQRVMESPLELRGTTVNWWNAIPNLLLWAAVISVVWGVLQRPSLKLPIYGAVLFPAVGVFSYFRVVVAAAGGKNEVLTAMMCALSLIAILIGNVIGFGFALADMQIHPPWTKVIAAYFEDYLPKAWVEESFYFLGGVAGMYFALGAYKPKTQRELLERL